MSTRFGPIFQMGYVVRDMDKAIAHWTKVMGVGPFFVASGLQFETFQYNGVKSKGIDMTAAHGFSGDVDIELICQNCDSPSIYQDFLKEKGEGMHHVGVLTDNYDADLERHIKSRLKVMQGGQTAPMGVKFAYFDNIGAYPGTMVELIENTPTMSKFLAMAKAKAANWDGSDPKRGR